MALSSEDADSGDEVSEFRGASIKLPVVPSGLAARAKRGDLGGDGSRVSEINGSPSASAAGLLSLKCCLRVPTRCKAKDDVRSKQKVSFLPAICSYGSQSSGLRVLVVGPLPRLLLALQFLP